MSQDSQQNQGIPIPFTQKQLDDLARNTTIVTGGGVPTTSIQDCLALKGHGGKDGSRVYFPSGDKLGTLLGEKRICEICGMVGV